MAYYDDDNFSRFERERERQDSRKINIALWPDQMLDSNLNGLQPDCEYCHRVLIPSHKTPGKLFCPDCGNEYGAEIPKPKPKRFKPKQSGAANPLIIASQSNKRKKRAGTEGDLELRKDLALTGVIDDASIHEY